MILWTAANLPPSVSVPPALRRDTKTGSLWRDDPATGLYGDWIDPCDFDCPNELTSCEQFYLTPYPTITVILNSTTTTWPVGATCCSWTSDPSGYTADAVKGYGEGSVDGAYTLDYKTEGGGDQFWVNYDGVFDVDIAVRTQTAVASFDDSCKGISIVEYQCENDTDLTPECDFVESRQTHWDSVCCKKMYIQVRLRCFIGGEAPQVDYISIYGLEVGETCTDNAGETNNGESYSTVGEGNLISMGENTRNPLANTEAPLDNPLYDDQRCDYGMVAQIGREIPIYSWSTP